MLAGRNYYVNIPNIWLADHFSASQNSFLKDFFSKLDEGNARSANPYPKYSINVKMKLRIKKMKLERN